MTGLQPPSGASGIVGAHPDQFRNAVLVLGKVPPNPDALNVNHFRSSTPRPSTRRLVARDGEAVRGNLGGRVVGAQGVLLAKGLRKPIPTSTDTRAPAVASSMGRRASVNPESREGNAVQSEPSESEVDVKGKMSVSGGARGTSI